MSGLKVLDLFSGIGGFSLGLERTGGFETVAFCEIDKKARLVLKKHWPNAPIFEDVTALTADQIHDKIDIIVGGFPCQDISVAGKGVGLAGARSGLWYEYHRLIKEIRPSWVVIENVSALRSRGLDAVLWSLAEIGYDAEWHCIPASAVGAPHRRDRIWIVAYPCGGQRSTRPEKQGVLQSLSQDGSINNNIGGRSEAHTANVADAKVLQQYGGDIDAKTGSASTSQSGNNSSADVMADAKSPRRKQPSNETNTGPSSGQSRDGFVSSGSTLSDALREGLERQWQLASGTSEEHKDIGNARWWAVEPDVGRVAHGVSGRVDRLKQLGNAVVPQIPELIGRAILATISEPSR